MTTPVKTDTHLKKWAMRELVTTMVFFIAGFALIPPSFFTNDENFNSTLAGLALGVGITRLIRLAQNVKSGKAAQDNPNPDCL